MRFCIVAGTWLKFVSIDGPIEVSDGSLKRSWIGYQKLLLEQVWEIVQPLEDDKNLSAPNG